ncbi:MAG: hypothetical protein R3F55_16225 [Alphaproteobacteria bacterium]
MALSPVAAARFDVADEAMAGIMDAGFFLTGHRNYVPHEYPCRRAYAARFRDRRPDRVPGFVQAAGAAGWWLHPGADRVDLSGFWHRPTAVEARACSGLRLAEPASLRLRLATCGAAMLWVDGAEAAWLAPCTRNLDAGVDATVDLAAGDHAIEVWFADLCERDTRWWFQLAVCDGGDFRVVVPLPVDQARAAGLLEAMAGLRFERAAFDAEPVALSIARPLRHAVDMTVTVEPRFLHSEGAAGAATVPAGTARLPVGAAASLPADFRDYTVTLADGPFALSRRLGVEVAHAGRPAAAGLAARIDEVLAHAGAAAEPGPETALAQLACGRAGPHADAILAATLPPIDDCWDCADFLLVPLLWARIRHGDAIGARVREQIDRAVLGFRYWLDEPGNDVMWFFSENHALLFHACAYLAGGLLADATFARSGRCGRDQQAVGRARLVGWFDNFEACGMAEWNAAPYIPIDLLGLAALFALAPDPEIRARAGRAILRLVEWTALASYQGLTVASQGRSYEHSLRGPRSDELSGLARLLWGRGRLGAQHRALPLLALALRDHGLVLPAALARIALWDDPRELEWTHAQGEHRLAALYHCKARHWAMGSVAAYRPGGWGYQETVLQARIGDHPDAQIWINHPGERLVGGFGRPSYWAGNATLPRVHQYRALGVLRFDGHPETPDFTHAHVAEAAYDAVVDRGRRLLLRAGDGLALLQAGRPLRRIDRGPTAGIEARQEGRRGDWLVRLSDLATEGSLEAFDRRMAGLDLRDGGDGAIRVDDPVYGPVVMAADGTVGAEGRTLDPATWTLAGRARLSDGTDLVLPSQQGDRP